MIEYFYHENIPPENDEGGSDMMPDFGNATRPAEEVTDQLY